MDCGPGNNHRYIDVSYTASATDAKNNGLAIAIPGLYKKKGKVKAQEILERDTIGTFTEFFGSMTSIIKPNQTITK